MKRTQVAAAAVAIAVVGTGGPAWAATHHPKVEKVNYAKKYLAIVAPANKATETFNKAYTRLPSSTTAAQLAKLTGPLVAVWQKAEANLVAVNWPAKVEPDMRTMVTDMGDAIGDLQALGEANLLTASSVTTKLSEDDAAENTAVGLVRHDLGLPQVNQ